MIAAPASDASAMAVSAAATEASGVGGNNRFASARRMKGIALHAVCSETLFVLATRRVPSIAVGRLEDQGTDPQCGTVPTRGNVVPGLGRADRGGRLPQLLRSTQLGRGASALAAGPRPEYPPPPHSHRSTVPSIGRYQIIESLGQGGMGTVYKAFDPLLARIVAVKVISAQLGASPDHH